MNITNMGLLIDKFINQSNTYISPEEELEIYIQIQSTIDFWLYILKYSDKKINELSSKEQKIIYEFSEKARIKLNTDLSIGIQLDKKIVEIILWGSIVSYNLSSVNTIYYKTKSSNKYFYYDLLIDAYLKLEDQDKAIEIIESMYSKDVTAQFYSLLKIKNKKEYIEFNNKLKELKKLSIINLLSKGERVDLINVSLQNLYQIINEIENKTGE